MDHARRKAKFRRTSYSSGEFIGKCVMPSLLAWMSALAATLKNCFLAGEEHDLG